MVSRFRSLLELLDGGCGDDPLLAATCSIHVVIVVVASSSPNIAALLLLLIVRNAVCQCLTPSRANRSRHWCIVVIAAAHTTVPNQIGLA